MQIYSFEKAKERKCDIDLLFICSLSEAVNGIPNSSKCCHHVWLHAIIYLKVILDSKPGDKSYIVGWTAGVTQSL